MPKSRNFAFLLYPESCCPSWQQILKDCGHPVMWILHDKDVVYDDTIKAWKPKKQHYHVMVMYDTPHSENTAKKLCIMCGGNGHLETIVTKKGYARYMTHKDDNNKYKYDDTDVICYGGVDYTKLASSDAELASKANDLLAELLTYIKRNNVIAYCVLVDYCVTYRRDWLELLRGRTGHLVSDYIKSRHWLGQYE